MPKLKASVQIITPAIARMWLDTTLKNRTLRQSRVKQYAADMKAGRWKLNGESIKFDSTGHLLNGQHRLHAVIEADVTVEMLVVYNVDPSAQTTMDSGLVAKLYDWSDIPYAKQTSQLCSTVVLMRWGNAHRGISRGEIEGVYKALGPDVVQYVIRKTFTGAAANAPVRAAIVLTHLGTKSSVGDVISPRAAEFIDRMVSMSTPKDSPENALLRSFNAPGGRSYSGGQRRDIAARAALAAIRSEKVKLLRPILAEGRAELFETVKIAFPETLDV